MFSNLLMLERDSVEEVASNNPMNLFVNDKAKEQEGVEREKKIVSFAATISSSLAHELKTPLAVLSLYTDLLGNYCKKKSSGCIDDDEKVVDQYICVLRKTIKDASCLINNLLPQVKGFVDGEVNKENFKCCSLLESIEEVLAQYPFKFGEQELILVDKEKDFVYFGNKTLTNHILFNLIQNALRVIHSSGKGTISIEIKLSDDFNTLVFTDTSIGIPKKRLSKIFDLFESSKDAYGTGVGLSFCAMVMRNFYGGSIDCLSKPGVYTKFVLKFPGMER